MTRLLAALLILPALALAACNSSGQQQGQAQPATGVGSFQTLQQQGQGQAQAAETANQPASQISHFEITDAGGNVVATFDRSGAQRWTMDDTTAQEPYDEIASNPLTLLSLITGQKVVLDVPGSLVQFYDSNGNRRGAMAVRNVN